MNKEVVASKRSCIQEMTSYLVSRYVKDLIVSHAFRSATFSNAIHSNVLAERCHQVNDRIHRQRAGD